MTGPDETEFFLGLERSVWQALRDGDAAADSRLLSDDFLGVYGTGPADKAAHVGQLDDGPTVSSFELTNPQVLRLADGVVALTYVARWRRARPPDGCALESMYITSIWRREAGRWLNIFSQDTPSR